jgi:putative ABC transport system permease protein
MTTFAHRTSLRGSGNGGVAGRRAVIRWAGRMFRREWRQQILIVTLLTVAVAAAIASITLVYNADPGEDPELGTADFRVNLDASDPDQLQAGLAAARRSFETIDTIAHRSVTVRGSVETVDFRAQDPAGPYGGVLLALREGSYPTQAGEVAVTDGVAELLQVEVGSTVTLEGERWTVVGIVENPRRLSEDFALVAPSTAFAADHVTVLTSASDQEIDSFYGPGDEPPPAVGTATRLGNDVADAPAYAMFSVSTVFMLLASLVAAAGFAVVAQRRLRQLGMLAAIGATEKQTRLVLLANGAIVGTIAAVVGTIVGLVGWLVFAPTLESAIGHRIDRLSLPWLVIVATVLLAILAATAAAWWPGRAVARVPVMLALSGRPPKPRPARHAAIAALALIGVGIACLALSNRERELLVVAGIVATTFGALLLGPLAIRIFSSVAGRVPIAPRLALRDLVRYQARSGAALAAVTLALGIAATVVVVASAEEAEAANQPINLSDRQMRIYLGPPDARDLTPADTLERIGSLTALVREIAGGIDRATVVPLRNAYQPEANGPVVGDTSTYPTVVLTKRDGKMFRGVGQTFVATPALLRYLGIDPGTIDSRKDFVVDPSVTTRGLVMPSFTEREFVEVSNVQRIDTDRRLLGSPHGEDTAGQATVLITLDGVRRNGWRTVPAGWMIESSAPLTSEQIADARGLAGDGGLTIEVQRGDGSNARTMAIAVGAGGLLALCILALTVGLIRGESARDLRTLTASGANSRVRRTLTATTAGALALLGALLGIAGAYVMLAATFRDDLGYLSTVPFLYLGLAVVGVPLVAAAAGWLVAGREPPAVARTVIE